MVHFENIPKNRNNTKTVFQSLNKSHKSFCLYSLPSLVLLRYYIGGMPIIKENFTNFTVNMEFCIGGMPMIRESFTNVTVHMEYCIVKNNGIHWKLQ